MNMKLRYLAATAAVVGLGLASPALAINVNLNGNGNLNGNLNASLNGNLNANVNATQNNSNASSSASATASSDGVDIDTGDITVSVQTLTASNTNHGMHAVVDMSGGDGGTGGTGGGGLLFGGTGGQGGTGGAAGNFNSGDNNVSGNAFAAYAGILNNAWNTGINSNAQAASSIAARGTVSFEN
jgi:hypothetical protein